jgi:bifunctional UDP-N-acetylglucosamine pyrophosphorylase/glucosamine-1-phosphate N-acetyltransferase
VVVTEGVAIGSGTVILPGSVLCGATVVGRDCVIGPNTVLSDTVAGDCCQLNNVQSERAALGDNCELGPWVRLRPGTLLGNGLRIGNFVELKNAEIGDGTKVAHLSYIGDATFGKSVNVGCGLAVANYDGKQKHRARVGDNAFLGCHNSLVAPVEVGAGAYTAAGSVITRDVPPGGFAIARAKQVNKENKENRGQEPV